MTDDFSEKVERIIGPIVSSLGFQLDDVDNNVDEGGRRGVVVYYRASDCKLQVYWSAREYEINVMIAPLDGPNEHGLYNRSKKWHYLNEFITRSDLPLEQLVQELKTERVNFESPTRWLGWLGERIAKYVPQARAGVLEISAQ